MELQNQKPGLGLLSQDQNLPSNDLFVIREDDIDAQVAASRAAIVKAIATIIKDVPVNNGSTPGNLPWAEQAAELVYSFIEQIALAASTMPLQPDRF